MADIRTVYLPFFYGRVTIRTEKRKRALGRNLTTIYRGRVVRLYLERVKLPNGHTIELEIIKHSGAAAVVPFADPRHVILIKQYRHAVGRFLYEIPAGKLVKNERPIQCARRELEEETGYRARRFRKLGLIFTSPGFCDEVIHLYSAAGLTRGSQNLETCEVLEALQVPWEKIGGMIHRGQIQDAKSIIGLQLANPRDFHNYLK